MQRDFAPGKEQKCRRLNLHEKVVVFIADNGHASAGSLTAEAAGKGVLALGADLSDSQKATVLSEMGLTDADLTSYDVIYITNDMEHQYLDSSLGASVVGTHSLSSVLLVPQESGAGLSVETHNVNYCTIAMYRNALLTAGVQDAKVLWQLRLR